MTDQEHYEEYERLNRAKYEPMSAYDVMEIVKEMDKHHAGWRRIRQREQDDYILTSLIRDYNYYKEKQHVPDLYKVGAKKGTPKALTKTQIKQNKEYIAEAVSLKKQIILYKEKINGH